MERNAFARARSFLKYRRGAMWLAILAGIGTAVFYVLLLLMLSLFTDLLIHRGRVPTFAQLSMAEQEKVLSDWGKLSAEDRAEAAKHLGGASSPLAATIDLPPVPARINRAELEKWADARKIWGHDLYLAAMGESELRWRAYVWLRLRSLAGNDAADAFQPAVNSPEDMPYPALGTGNQAPHGALSLVVRQRDGLGGKILGWFASWNPWMWQPASGLDANQRYLTGLLLIALTLVLLRVACLLIMHRAAAKTTLEAITRIRRALYHHSSRLGGVAAGRDPAETSGLFTRHAEAIHEALYVWLTSTFRYPVLFGLLILTALVVHPLLALTCVIFGLLVWILGGQLAAALWRQERDATRHAGTRLTLLLESLRMMRLVKGYLMERFNQSRVERQLADYARAHDRRYRGEALAKPILVLLGWMAAVTLLYLAGRMVLSETLGVSSLIVLMTTLASLYIPIRAHFDQRRILRRGRDAAAAAFAFLERKPDVTQMMDAAFLPAMSDRLEYRDVTLREPGTGRMVLRGVNLSVKAGQQVGILGPDQDANLALMYLLPRFIDPTGGEVRIDGRNLKWVTTDSLRTQVALVLQKQLVFNDTVANNIGCGDPSFTLPQIIEAAKLAHAHKFIQNLPYGYETVIGELGHSLKFVDQFRVALARAILRDPSVLVIEEPSIALDEDTKALLDDTLDRIVPGRTVIYLPHRIATLRHCDVIFMLNDGLIEAAGTHRQLLDGNELYRHLHYLEFNTFADQVAG